MVFPRFAAFTCLFLPAATSLVGCGHDFSQDVDTPPITVPTESVAYTIDQDGYLRASLEATYTNRTGATTYLWHYMGSDAALKYVFERKNADGSWGLGWGGGGPIGEFPVEVAPGASLTRALIFYDDVSRPAEERNFLILPEAGEYRAVYFVTTDREGNHEVPLPSRISEPFQLVAE
ncbi:MAG: hypothetical protein M3Y59_25465 [Myxococcota bacterium]|nr:hypothetical protein [Myxococcota bacterium]